MIDRSDPKAVYRELLRLTAAELAKTKKLGFRSVQVFGATPRTCPVCRSLMGSLLPVTTPAKDILRPDCERFKSGGYHCAPSISAAIKDGLGNVRFER